MEVFILLWYKFELTLNWSLCPANDDIKTKLDQAWTFFEEYAISDASNSLIHISDQVDALFPNRDLFPDQTIVKALHTAIGKVFPEPDAPADLEAARSIFSSFYEMLKEVSSLF